MRTRLAGGLAVLIVGAVPPAGVSATAPVEMTGTVTMSGSSSYVREFVLRKSMTFSAASFSLKTAGGRFSGFVLRKAGSGSTPTVAVVAPGYCTARGCARPAWSGTFARQLYTGVTLPPGAPADRAPLSPGRYAIHLVADGKPVSVTLRFGGSRRTTVIAGSRGTVAIDVPAPAQYEPATPAGDTGHLYAAGATHRVQRRDGFRLFEAWKLVLGAPRGAHQEGICEYDGPPVVGHTGPYQYPCHGGDVANFFVFGQQPIDAANGEPVPGTRYAALLSDIGVFEDKDVLSVGGFINSATPAVEAHAAILWVDFR